MNTIVKFLTDHKISTHSIATGLLFLIGAYATVPSFATLVNHIAARHPNLDEIGTAAVGLFMLYSRSTKDQAK